MALENACNNLYVWLEIDWRFLNTEEFFQPSHFFKQECKMGRVAVLWILARVSNRTFNILKVNEKSINYTSAVMLEISSATFYWAPKFGRLEFFLKIVFWASSWMRNEKSGVRSPSDLLEVSSKMELCVMWESQFGAFWLPPLIQFFILRPVTFLSGGLFQLCEALGIFWRWNLGWKMKTSKSDSKLGGF